LEQGHKINQNAIAGIIKVAAKGGLFEAPSIVLSRKRKGEVLSGISQKLL